MVTTITGAGQSVVILGMHRSGTSAVTRVVNLLGPALCGTDDLLDAADDNPTGFWESRTLVAFNDRLLQLLGGNYAFPPHPDPGWHSTAEVRSLEGDALDTFRAVHPSTPWVWKDPRTCLTWPFWRSCLDEDPVPLLVFRNPFEVARSLARRGDCLGPAHAVALWERYTHEALVSVAGGAALMVDYATVVTEPKPAVTALAAHLRNAGVEVRPEQVGQAASFVGRTTCQPVTAGLHSQELNGGQRDLIRYVHHLVSESHARVIPEEIPPLSAAGTELLDALRREWHAKSRRISIREAVMTNPRVVGVRKRAAVRTRVRSHIVSFLGN